MKSNITSIVNGHSLAAGFMCAAAAALCCHAGTPPQYTMTDIGWLNVSTQGQRNTRALAASDSGIVVGESGNFSLFNDPAHAFKWTAADGIQDLHNFAPIPNFLIKASRAQAVSDSGHVAGNVWVVPAGFTNGSINSRAWRYSSAGGSVILDTAAANAGLYSSVGFGDVLGIDEEGTFLMSWRNANDFDTHALLHSLTEGWIDIRALLPGNVDDVTPIAINQPGQALGWVRLLNTVPTRALWLYTPGEPLHLIAPLGPSGPNDFTDINGYALNDHGAVIGRTTTPDGWRGFYWTAAGGMELLNDKIGVLPGEDATADAINNAGQIILTITPLEGAPRYVRWTPNSAGGGGEMVDLGMKPPSPDGEWRLASINEPGHVSATRSESKYGPFEHAVWSPQNGIVFTQDLIDPPGGLAWFDSAGGMLQDTGQLIVNGSRNDQNRLATLVLTPLPEPIPGDVTGDGVVNVNDLLAVVGAWGACPLPPGTCAADVNHDGLVDVNDLLIVVGNWT